LKTLSSAIENDRIIMEDKETTYLIYDDTHSWMDLHFIRDWFV